MNPPDGPEERDTWFAETMSDGLNELDLAQQLADESRDDLEDGT